MTLTAPNSLRLRRLFVGVDPPTQGRVREGSVGRPDSYRVTIGEYCDTDTRIGIPFTRKSHWLTRCTTEL
jgi:hypothetical protein